MANYNIDTLAEIILSELDRLNKSNIQIQTLLRDCEEKSKKENVNSIPLEIPIFEKIDINIKPVEKILQNHIQRIEFLQSSQKEVIPKWMIFYAVLISIALVLTLLILLK